MRTNYFLVLTFISITARSGFCQSPDWSTDIASIVYDNCSTCHREGEIAPFPLMSYEDAVLNATGMVTQTSAGLMPPYPADPDYRHYLDETVLSEAEKNLIAEWVDAGTPAGDTSLAPDPPVFPAGSQLGTPDIVLSMAEAYHIAGDGLDRYMIFVLPSSFATDKNISGIEFRPGNKAAIHHVFIYTDTTGVVAAQDALTPEYGFEGSAGSLMTSDFVTLYRPGMNARFLPEGMAYKFRAGTDIIFQIHYAPLNYTATDSSSVNLFFSDVDSPRLVMPLKVTESKITEPSGLFVPANTVVTFHSESQLDDGDFSWIGISPHAHQLCTSFKVYAVNPFGDTIPLVSVPQWNFDWQLFYNFTSLQKLENGTMLYSEGTYDNTVNNPNNPNNPPVDVSYGTSSLDEMFRYFYIAVNYEAGDEDIILDSSIALTSPPVNGVVNTPQFYSCYPNPASAEIAFSFYLPWDANVSLSIHDVKGNLVAAPITSMMMSQGFHKTIFCGSDLPPGTYICRLESGNFSKSKMLVILR